MSVQTITARAGLLHGTGLAKTVDCLGANGDYNYFTGFNAAIVRAAGTFAKLKIVLDLAPGGSLNSTHVIQKNFVDTALTVTISGAAVTAIDSTHSVHFDVGDFITLKSTGDNTAPDTGVVYVLEFTPDTPGESIYGFVSVSTLNAAQRIFGAGGNSDANQATSICPINGALTSYGVYAKTAPGVGKTVTLNLVKNGVVQDGSGGTVNTTATISGTNQDASWAGSLPLVAGDLVSLKAVYSAGATSDWTFVGYSFLADTPGEYVMESSWNFLTTADLFGAGPMLSPFFQYPSATETARLLYVGSVDVLFGVPWAYVGLTSSFETTVAKLRVNQGNPIGAPTVTMSTPHSAVQGSGSVNVPAGSSFTIEFKNPAVSAGGPESASLSFGIGVAAPPTPEPEFKDGTVSHPLTWLEFTDRNNNLKVFAEVDLCDDPDYFGGYKFPWVNPFNTIQRGLSDFRGQVEHMLFGAVLSDLPDINLSASNPFFRALLGSPGTKYITNRPLVERMIDDEDRRQKKTPRIVACGYVNDYSPTATFKFTLSGSDWLQKKFYKKRKAEEAWQDLITLTDFPNAPPDNIGKAIPKIYGIVADDYISGISGGPVQIAIKTGTVYGFYKHALGLGNPELGVDWHPTDDYTLATDYPAVPANVRSWGVLPGSKPTGLSVTDVAGGSLPGNWRSPEDGQTWSVMVTAIHSGVESDPTNVKSAYLHSSMGNHTIRVSWTAASGGANGGYNVYFAPNTYAVDAAFSTYACNPKQVFFIGESDVRMVHVGSGVTTLDIVSLSDGVPYPVENVYVYVVCAINADGTESPPSEPILGMVHPYTRPLHIRWYPYSGATGYRIKRAVYPGPDTTPNFNTVIEVGATGATGPQTIEGTTQYELFDDFTNAPPGTVSVTTGTPTVRVAKGQIAPIHVGKIDIGMGIGPKETFLVAGHACKTVRSNYLNGTLVDNSHYGVDVWSPGQAGWTLGTNYVVINGKWMTVVQLDGKAAQGAIDGSAKLTCNVLGIEDVGDSSGNCILDGTSQLLHFMQNFIAPDNAWTHGAWLTTPDFPAVPGLGIIDNDSFQTTLLSLFNRIGNFYEGGGVIGPNGDIESAIDVIAKFLISYDFDAGFNRKGQFFVSAEPTVPITGEDVTDVLNISDGSFTIEDRVSTEFFNVLPWTATRDYAGWTKTGWNNSGDVIDAASVTLYDQERESPPWNLEFCRTDTTQGQTTLFDTMQRKQARFANPRRWVTLTLPFSGLTYELGDVIPVSSLEGIGGGMGWDGNNCRVMRHEAEPTDGNVKLSLVDLTPIFRGAYILGDENTLAADWTTAPAFDKQYGYLADENTGLFTDGDPGKVLT